MKRGMMMENSTYLVRGISLGNILLTFLIAYFIFMDVELYFRTQNYPLRKDIANTTSYPADCLDISPFCYISVKAVMLDHINLYIFGPLIKLFDIFFHISDLSWITPNMISVSHVVVAVISGKCISSHALSTRRMGVALFELRTMLDDLDGHVARERKHIHGEISEVGTSGYVIDGVCDALGIVCLIVGIFIFLKNNPSRRDYLALQVPVSDKMDISEPYRKKLLNKRLFQTVSCITLQLMISSTSWNRYIALYQDLLEGHKVTQFVDAKQLDIFRSNYFLLISFFWRICNVHSYIHLLLLGIAYDKLWEILRHIKHVGFFILLALICLSEFHVVLVEEYIFGNTQTFHNSTSF